SLVLSLLLAAIPAGAFPQEVHLPGLAVYLDSLSVFFVLLVNVVAFFASWYTAQFLQRQPRGPYYSRASFHFFFNLFHFTMLVVPIVDNLVILWMAIELTTLASTLLVGYER